MNFERGIPVFEKLRLGKAGVPFVISHGKLRLVENREGRMHTYALSSHNLHATLEKMAKGVIEMKISWDLKEYAKSCQATLEVASEDDNFIDIIEFSGGYVEYEGILYPIAMGVEKIETTITINKVNFD